MVILFSKEGQLANRLWQAAHFISNAIEYDYNLLHKGFGDYFEYFSESINHFGNFLPVCFPQSANGVSITAKLALKYYGLSKKLERKLRFKLPFVRDVYFHDYTALRYYLNNDSFLNDAKSCIVSVDGWFYEDKTSLIKHADIIRSIFQPNKVFQYKIDQLYSTHFKKYDIVVAVHIRKGDYKTYNNGIWYYSDEEYCRFMEGLLGLEEFNQSNVGFLVCSNEKLNDDFYQKFNIIPATNHFIEDLYAMAKCDYIIGPPSTFSAWASFYGNVPLLHLYNSKADIKKELFKVVDYAY